MTFEKKLKNEMYKDYLNVRKIDSSKEYTALKIIFDDIVDFMCWNYDNIVDLLKEYYTDELYGADLFESYDLDIESLERLEYQENILNPQINELNKKWGKYDNWKNKTRNMALVFWQAVFIF